MTQYTTYADGFNERRARDRRERRRPRPALAAWCAMPEYVAAPVQRAAWRAQL